MLETAYGKYIDYRRAEILMKLENHVIVFLVNDINFSNAKWHEGFMLTGMTHCKQVHMKSLLNHTNVLFME